MKKWKSLFLFCKKKISPSGTHLSEIQTIIFSLDPWLLGNISHETLFVSRQCEAFIRVWLTLCRSLMEDPRLEYPPCLLCGGTNFIDKKSVGDVVCGSCGCVIMDHMINYQPEWKGFAKDDTKVGSAEAFARCSRACKMQILREVQTTFLRGGGDSQREELSRIYKSFAFSRKEIKYFKCLEYLQRLCHCMRIQQNVEVGP